MLDLVKIMNIINYHAPDEDKVQVLLDKGMLKVTYKDAHPEHRTHDFDANFEIYTLIPNFWTSLEEGCKNLARAIEEGKRKLSKQLFEEKLQRFRAYAIVGGQRIPVEVVRVLNPFCSELKYRYIDSMRTIYEVRCPAELVGELGGDIYSWYPKLFGHQCFFFEEDREWYATFQTNQLIFGEEK